MIGSAKVRRLALVVGGLLLAAGALIVWRSTDPSTVATRDGGSDRFPSETLADWVAFADQASVVSVAREKAMPLLEGETDEPGDGYRGRIVTLEIERTIWRRPEAPFARDAVRVTAWGWSWRDERWWGLIPGKWVPTDPWGVPRLEVGKRYLVPLLLAPDERETSEWMYLSDDTIFPLDGERITTEGVSEGDPSSILEDSDGLRVSDLAEKLAATEPHPLAAKYAHLDPDARWEAMSRERGES